MKILVTTRSILDTENIRDNPNVKHSIEKVTFNKENDNLIKLWAVSEAKKHGTNPEIFLELL